MLYKHKCLNRGERRDQVKYSPPNISNPSSPVSDEIEKMCVYLDWLTYELSVGITIEDIEEDACIRALRRVSGCDVEPQPLGKPTMTLLSHLTTQVMT